MPSTIGERARARRGRTVGKEAECTLARRAMRTGTKQSRRRNFCMLHCCRMRGQRSFPVSYEHGLRSARDQPFLRD
jgi:hypothetical protein